ncbi:MAG: lysine N(6)-hydroxylase/L-ornithine N(5)-oxygenase family protein [Alphaproteobacteria bacterium]|nr:lysine N(6)-hydroxylase/L-ornithine N(5)-oxygenase family protein [Alphaproteobacteria bacterium]
MNNQLLNIIGIGLGPSNLALAAAIEEKKSNLNSTMSCLFLDSKHKFEWHSGMLIPGMQLQVPFFRDLATVRNPQSPFTFLNYLKSKNRLDQFINLRTFYPTRIEYHDYLSWVCEKLTHITRFGCKVKLITPIWDKKSKTIKKLEIVYEDERDESIGSYIAENIVISLGGEPYIPACVKVSQDDNRLIHTASLLEKVPKHFTNLGEKYHFIVVGSGQSAGEATYYLLNQYPNAKVSLCFRNFSLNAIDNSPFVNQKYHHSSVDDFYHLSGLSKAKALHDLKASNYSVIDIDLLNELFKVQYYDSLQQKERLNICPGLNLESIISTDSYVQIEAKDLYNETTTSIRGDAVILATGYTQDNYKKILSGLNEHLIKNNDGEYLVSRNYQIQTSTSMQASVYLQGYCEHSHGPSDSTLAIMSTRAESILEAIVHDSSPFTEKERGFNAA